MKFLTICLISKNESPYLAEWLEYHIMLGVQHFYIYDNGSEDDPTPIYDLYHDYVTVYPWLVSDNQQKLAYQHFILSHGHEAKWTAFIDADEFIVYTGTGDFVQYLNGKDAENGIMMQWELFGTNGHITRPDGLVLENYCRSYSKSPTPNIKTVCQSRRVIAADIVSPHRFPYHDGRSALPEKISVVSVYHYVLRSRQDLVEKLSRGDVWSATRATENMRDLERAIQARLALYDHGDKVNSQMLGVVPELKKRLVQRQAVRESEGKSTAS